MPYQGPPMTRDVPVLALELARLTGMSLVGIESYADGEVTDPTIVHVSVVARIGERVHPEAPQAEVFMDAKGKRDYSEVVRGLFGATFGARRLSEDDVRALAEAAPQGRMTDREARNRAAEVSAAIDTDPAPVLNP